MNKELKFAILIDADNISEKYIKIILDETAKSGIATYKRIYGDWTNPQLSSWKRVFWTTPSFRSSSTAIPPERAPQIPP